MRPDESGRVLLFRRCDADESAAALRSQSGGGRRRRRRRHELFSPSEHFPFSVAIFAARRNSFSNATRRSLCPAECPLCHCEWSLAAPLYDFDDDIDVDDDDTDIRNGLNRSASSYSGPASNGHRRTRRLLTRKRRRDARALLFLLRVVIVIVS